MKTKTYRLTQDAYREGRYLRAGEVITIPANEEPSRTWQEVKADEDAPKAAPSKRDAPKGRASDSTVI